MQFYEKQRVTIVPIDDVEVGSLGSTIPGHEFSIIELLEFMAGFPIKDQVYMLANTLTISGFSQREIATALGVSYQTYRNRLWDVRLTLKDRGIKDF